MRKISDTPNLATAAVELEALLRAALQLADDLKLDLLGIRISEALDILDLTKPKSD